MVRAPEITGDVWFNTSPLKTGDLAGRVVMADFWTYSCVNCQRTLPYLRQWWDKYRNIGFVLIGIHTPEFAFEKEPANVAQAIQELGVTWPVVMDNDYLNWNNFANRYWPAKYLINREGKIAYHHFGEGAYEETEHIIQKLLKESNGNVKLPPVDLKEHIHGICFVPTPETYCGYLRGTLANPGGYRPDMTSYYSAPVKLGQDQLALEGKFFAAREYVESAEPGAQVRLNFRASEVNLVMHPVGRKAAVEVSYNGELIPENIRGKDVNSDSVLTVISPTLYNLIRANEFYEGVVSVRAKEGNFRAYAFTFSGCT